MLAVTALRIVLLFSRHSFIREDADKDDRQYLLSSRIFHAWFLLLFYFSPQYRSLLVDNYCTHSPVKGDFTLFYEMQMLLSLIITTHYCIAIPHISLSSLQPRNGRIFSRQCLPDTII